MDTQESSSDLPILRQPKSRVDSARPAGPQEGAAAFWLQGVVLVARMMDRRVLLVAALAQLLWQFQIGSLDNPAYSTTLCKGFCNGRCRGKQKNQSQQLTLALGKKTHSQCRALLALITEAINGMVFCYALYAGLSWTTSVHPYN